MLWEGHKKMRDKLVGMAALKGRRQMTVFLMLALGLVVLVVRITITFLKIDIFVVEFCTYNYNFKVKQD